MSMRSSTISIIKENAPLKHFSTIKIGGTSRYLVEVTTEKELCDALLFAKERGVGAVILGRGSNLLIEEGLFPGLTIINRIGGIRIEGTKVWVGSGVHLSYLSLFCSRLGLSGLEFLTGIPGTVGGALCMNAGIQTSSTSDSLLFVEALTREGEKLFFSKEELSFGYRKSSFHSMEAFILAACFDLVPSSAAEEVRALHLKKRLESQPYKELSLGSIFKNPKDGYAGQWIEECGLKGRKIGGAFVSEKHANFILNDGSATFSEVMQLVEEVQKEVKWEKNVQLELEVIPWYMTSTHTRPVPMG